MKRIFVAQPLIEQEEIDSVVGELKAGFISGTAGKALQEFEAHFARFCGVKHALAVSSGTAALHVSVLASNIGPGDEVITSNITNIATLFAIVYCGAKPVVVDCEPDTFNMDVTKIEKAVTEKTKAIMPVHIYGHPVDMDPLREISAKNNLTIIEDAAEAHGSLYKGRKCGSIGDIGCFSFYANKIISTGEGGMVTTNSDEIADRVRDLRNLSYGKVDRFTHETIGYNYRMSNVLAAIGVAQLRKIDRFIEKKRWIAKQYENHLKDSNLQLPVEKTYAKNVYWMYAILTKDREKFSQKLGEKGIETRPFFNPMNKQPCFIERGIFTGKELFPVSDHISKYGVYLPSGFDLTSEDINYVCDAIMGK